MLKKRKKMLKFIKKHFLDFFLFRKKFRKKQQTIMGVGGATRIS